MTNTQVSGIGVYNKNLFASLKNELHDDVLPVLKWSRIKKANIVEEHLSAKVRALPPFLFNKEIVYHGTDHKLNTRARGPKVVTIHDMQPFTGKWLDPVFAKKRVEIMTHVFKSDVQRIIAISQFTKQEIIKYFPETINKIDVVYHGHNFNNRPVAAKDENNVIKNIAKGRPFLFFIGNLEERKNLINQMKAFEIMKERHKDLIFILSGREGFNYKEIAEYISYSKFKNDIYVTGYLSEADKDYAMENTACLMFASWYEGFGFPLLEALSTNTNIIISRGSALDEIGKEYCYQCNPKDPSDIACSVEIIMDKGNLKKVNLDSWKSEWSWEKCASETIKVYKKSFDYM
ncbi:MAG: glycosyltransferase family 4 protein [Rhizobacter sp.]|nr:glycosyltransferase family 4 protein [Bacteriovorax sp.]